MKKKCAKCGETKPLSEFYRNRLSKDGHLNHCKECQDKLSFQWRKKNRKICCFYNKRWRENNPGYLQPRYPMTEKTRESIKKGQLKYRIKYPEKFKAYRELKNAIKEGRIKREPCEICGNKLSEGHHFDYTKPLEVVWLCRKCHRGVHRLEREIGNKITKFLKETI